MTGDGRPFVRDDTAADDLAMWAPEPPRDGDPVLCCGVRVGTFHDNGESRPDYSDKYLEMVPTKEMPAALAAHTRERINTKSFPWLGHAA